MKDHVPKGPGTWSTSLVMQKAAHCPDGRPPSAPLTGDSGLCLFFSETKPGPLSLQALEPSDSNGMKGGRRGPGQGNLTQDLHQQRGGEGARSARGLLSPGPKSTQPRRFPSGKHGPEALAMQLSLSSRMDSALVRRSWRLSRARSRSIYLQKGCRRDRHTAELVGEQ